MGSWISADEFIEADVIRWTEGIFDRRRGGKKAQRIGERLMTAEVLRRTEDGWLTLLIRGCSITRDDFAGRKIPSLKIESEVRRAIKTVLRGKPERLLWSDEDARLCVVRQSRFLPS